MKITKLVYLKELSLKRINFVDGERFTLKKSRLKLNDLYTISDSDSNSKNTLACVRKKHPPVYQTSEEAID